MCGFIAQFVENRTGDRRPEVTGLNPVEVEFFSGFFFPNFINWWAYGEDRAILSFLQSCISYMAMVLATLF